ncbi:unnamed protein product [Rotaria sp. Silwood1]|nr:unnamed protein product [Rotaria sp. Silwood1]
MSIQFSIKSIEYLTEKLNNDQCLSDESLTYLTLQTTELIFNLLQDACKVVRKCRRKEMTTEDFAFALKLYHLESMYGYNTTLNIHRSLFRKIKKDNRILYHIDDNIIPLDDLITSQLKIPFDISIHGVHSVNFLEAAGFHYTHVGDTARCNDCQLEVASWTLDMNPFSVHAQRSPNCKFVKSIKSSTEVLSFTSSHTSTAINIDLPTTDSSKEEDMPSKRQKIEATSRSIETPPFVEVEMVKKVRRQTFSHWPHRTSPSQTQMIQAGFFNCNVGDRVICIYCNLICQQWTPHTDDPCEVHKTLSPKCPFVVNMLIRREATPPSIINLSSVTNGTSAVAGVVDAFRSHEIVLAAACNSYYIEIPKRHQSFATWPNEPLPSVDDLVRAGFFYNGTGTIVTCFYCNGSLQNWGANDNPIIEHARWFPHCGYAKQLCGDDLYRKIQESKRSVQERTKPKEPTNNVTSGAQKLQISDESTLSRLVAARLDLPISQNLLNQNFKLSIIKRCWEDQLRLKCM